MKHFNLRNELGNHVLYRCFNSEVHLLKVCSTAQADVLLSVAKTGRMEQSRRLRTNYVRRSALCGKHRAFRKSNLLPSSGIFHTNDILKFHPTPGFVQECAQNQTKSLH
jgi:hypothetical protein